MPPHFLLDPYVVRLPDEATRSRHEGYFDSLRNWGARLVNLPDQVSVSERVILQLIEDDAYPTYAEIASRVRRYGLSDFYGPQDLANALRSVTERRPYLEDRVGIQDLVVDADSTVLPTQLLERLNGATAQLQFNAIFAAAIGLKHDGWDVEPLFYGSCDCPEGATDVLVNGKVLAVDRSGAIEEKEVLVECELELVDGNVEDVPQHDILELAELPQQAVEWSIRNLPADKRPIDARSVATGPNFVASLSATGISRNRTLLRRTYYLAAMALCERIVEVNGADLHPVRTSKAGDAPQVERGSGDKLWRCKISQHGAGFRLHYWSLVGGGIELDSVMTESEV